MSESFSTPGKPAATRRSRSRRNLIASLSPFASPRPVPRRRHSTADKLSEQRSRGGGNKRKMPETGQSEAGNNNTKRVAMDSNIDTIAGLAAMMHQGFDRIETSGEVIQRGFDNLESRMTASENKFDKMINAMKQEQTTKDNEHEARFSQIEGQQTRMWDYIRHNNPVSDSFRSELRKEIAIAEKNLVLRGLNNDPTEQ